MRYFLFLPLFRLGAMFPTETPAVKAARRD